MRPLSGPQWFAAGLLAAVATGLVTLALTLWVSAIELDRAGRKIERLQADLRRRNPPPDPDPLTVWPDAASIQADADEATA